MASRLLVLTFGAMALSIAALSGIAGDDEAEHRAAFAVLRSSKNAKVSETPTGDARSVTLRDPTIEQCRLASRILNVYHFTLNVGDLDDRCLSCLEDLPPHVYLLVMLPYGTKCDTVVERFPEVKSRRRIELCDFDVPVVTWRAIMPMLNTEHLELTRCKLNSDAVKSLATNAHVRQLMVNSSPWNGAGLSALSETKLDAIELHGTELNDEGLAELSKISSLRQLRIHHGRLSQPAFLESTLVELTRLENLESFKLGYCDVSDETLTGFAAFKNLKHLDISDTGRYVKSKFTGATLATLKDLPLESVAFGSTRLGDEGFAALAKFPKLKSIWAHETMVTPAGLAAFEGLDRELKLSVGATQILPSHAQAFSRRNPKVEIETRGGVTYKGGAVYRAPTPSDKDEPDGARKK